MPSGCQHFSDCQTRAQLHASHPSPPSRPRVCGTFFLLAGDNQNHRARQNVSLSHLGFVEITRSSRSALAP